MQRKSVWLEAGVVLVCVWEVHIHIAINHSLIKFNFALAATIYHN